MKQLVRWTVPFAAAVVVTACGNNKENTSANKEGNEQTPTDKNQATGQHAGSVRLKDDKLNAVYQHYLHLTTALTNSDAAEAKVAASAIEAGAKELDGGKEMAAAAAKITQAGNVEEQRAAYEDLSRQMMDKVKTSGLASGSVYVQHCPMAFNDKGASWLSSSKEIRNPYFGKKMMTCGETKETIQ